jgi:cephalosporin-C deacetylase-like acetyl esterase
VYENSLVLLMGFLFFASWFGQSVTGWTKYNEDQKEHDGAAVSWTGYVSRSDFWEDTLQNWQSEFLAVGTMAVFTIYLRQRGSPESKPVGAPHTETGTSG